MSEPSKTPPDAQRPDDDSSAHAHQASVVNSDQLLQGRRELLIRHGDKLYRLRLTRSGKLILHK